MRFAAIFPIFLMVIAPALADPSPGPSGVVAGSLQGDYYFYSLNQKRGAKLCAERWRFGNDGTLIVFSGQEVVTEHFRVEQRQSYSEFARRMMSESWLVITNPVTNGLPDCLGATHTSYEPQNEMIVFRAADGGIVTSRAVGSILYPFGHFYLARDVDAKTAPKP